MMMTELQRKLLESSADMNALLKDAKRQLNKEDCAPDMEGKDYAGAKDAQIKLGEVECATGTGQSSNSAVAKGVQILLRMLECAGGMEQRSKNAVAKDVQNKLGKVGCA